MRIGFLSVTDPYDPGPLDGLRAGIRRGLAAQGHEVVDLVPPPSGGKGLRRLVPPVLRRGLCALVPRLSPPAPAPSRVPDSPEAVYTRAVEEAALLSRAAQRDLFALEIDLLFSCCSTPLLADLLNDLPVVHYGDTTAQLAAADPGARDRSPGAARARDHLERVGLRRASRVVMATRRAARSAVLDYGVAAERVCVVPPGPRVPPRRPLLEPARQRTPSRGGLRLLTVRGDPRRRRLDCALDTLATLHAWGWSAELTVVGQPTPRRSAPGVRWTGALDLERARDRRRYRRALARSHALLLPSDGEDLGLPVADAAHVGRPAVVSSAGALPEVVLDERTGRVVRDGARSADYAAAVVDLVESPVRYREACAQALLWARDVISWDRWAEGLRPVLSEATAEPAGAARAAGRDAAAGRDRGAAALPDAMPVEAVAAPEVTLP